MEHFLISNRLAKNTGTSIYVQRTEISKLPPYPFHVYSHVYQVDKNLWIFFSIGCSRNLYSLISRSIVSSETTCNLKYFCNCSETNTAEKMKFFIKDFFSKCDQIRRKLRIWLHLLKKSLMENFIFCAVKAFFNTSGNFHHDW